MRRPRRDTGRCEALEERVIGESLEGKSPTIVAEIVKDDGAYRICADLLYPNNPNREVGCRPFS